MSADIFTFCDGVIYFEVEDGTARLLNLDNHFHGLSSIATQMLRTTLDVGPDAAVERLAQEYAIPVERIRDDLTTLFSHLERMGLIRRTSDCPPNTGAIKSILCRGVALMLWGARLAPGKRSKVWLLLSLAWLSCRLLGWTRTVAVWRIGFQCDAKASADPQTEMRAINFTVRSAAASHLLSTECKERALTTWALGRSAGIPVEVVVGIHPFPLEGHCWCVYGDAVYSDDPERCAQFKPVWRCA